MELRRLQWYPAPTPPGLDIKRSGPVSDLDHGYKKAATAVMNAAISALEEGPTGALTASSLLPPYLFLWRHHFELLLKKILQHVVDDLSVVARVFTNVPGPAWQVATGQPVERPPTVK